MRGLDFTKYGITYETLKNAEYVLAFDLGHGESSVSYVNLGGSNGNIEQLGLGRDDEKKVITGLFKLNRNSKEWELRKLSSSLATMSEVHIQFKAIPAALNSHVLEDWDGISSQEQKRYEKKALVQAFVKTVLNNIRKYSEDKELPPEKTILFVGCPSSEVWKSQEIEYAKIIREASPYPVVIMPESRAALFKMVMDRQMLSGLGSLEDGVVVFDFGSITADWTYLYRNIGKGEFDSDEDSEMLGAHLIEERMADKGIEIFLAAREAERQRENEEKIKGFEDGMRAVLPKNSYTDAEIHEMALQKYRELKKDSETESEGKKDSVRQFEKNRQRLLLELRNNKENYFNSDREKFRQSYSGMGLKFEIDRQFMEGEDGVIFREGKYTGKTGISSGSGWYQECEKFFLGVKKRLEGRPYKIIILTGGASRMGFVQNLAGKVFTGKTVTIDPNPSTCVSRGMAYAGEMDIRARLALPDVMDKLLQKLTEEEFLAKCAKSVSEGLANTIFNEAIWKGLLEWRDMDGYLTVKYACDVCKERLKALQNQESFKLKVKQAIRKGIIDEKAEIVRTMNETYSSIYNQTVPANYKLQIDETKLRNIAGDVINYTFRGSFENIVAAALSYAGGGFLNSIFGTTEYAQTPDERKRKIKRIEDENRKPKLVEYCEVYLKEVLGSMFKKDTTVQNLRACLEPAVQKMLDDLSAYFA